MNAKKVARKIFSLARVLILQDLFLAYRQTRKVSRYTVVKIMEELFVVFCITLFNNNDLYFLISLAGVVHIVYAFFAPPLYNFLGVKSKLKPVSREKALTILSTLLYKVNKYVKKIYVTGSICYAQEVRDVDMILVPTSYFSAYILFIYLRIWIFKFIMHRIPFFPDVYIHEYNLYSYICDLKLNKLKQNT